MPTKRALSPLPESPGDIVLGIRLARDVFVEAAHEPGEVHQAQAALGEGFGIGQQDLAPLRWPTRRRRADSQPVPSFGAGS
jgi:hypothetical protein